MFVVIDQDEGRIHGVFSTPETALGVTTGKRAKWADLNALAEIDMTEVIGADGAEYLVLQFELNGWYE